MANFLTRLAPDDQRAHKRRQTNVGGTIYYLRRGVRGHSFQPCRMVNISESGCLLQVGAPALVPDHLYLVLETIKAKLSGAVVARSETGLHIRFATLIPSDIVDGIARSRLGSARRERVAEAG